MEQSIAGRTHRVLSVALTVLTISGCLDDKDNRSAGTSGNGFTNTTALARNDSEEGNSPPAISGAPALEISVGDVYSFQPTSSDRDGDRLGFSVRNKPRWASFDPNNGRLWGTPSMDDMGLASGIVISVSDSKAGAALSPFSIRVLEPGAVPPLSPGDAPPTISGTPFTMASLNELYIFVPTASDPDGDELSFMIMNQPGWLSFDSASGTLSGLPAAEDVGTHADILISVTDGISTRSLQPFSIDVVAVGNHSITLSWMPPTQNEDGSALSDLAGYRIWYGHEAGNYPNLIDLNNPGLTAYGVDGLLPNTYHFVITAYNTGGIESDHSNEASITLN